MVRTKFPIRVRYMKKLCTVCGIKDTPQWRKTDCGTMCNRCGIQFLRKSKKCIQVPAGSITTRTTRRSPIRWSPTKVVEVATTENVEVIHAVNTLVQMKYHLPQPQYDWFHDYEFSFADARAIQQTILLRRCPIRTHWVVFCNTHRWCIRCIDTAVFFPNEVYRFLS
jgi:hypothetical protein